MIAGALLATISNAQTATTAGFTIPSGTVCQGSSVVFTSTTASLHRPHLSFYWDFGWGGSPSPTSWNMETPPPVTFYSSGAPMVNLRVYDSVTNMYSEYMQSVTVYPTPWVSSLLPSSPTITCADDSVILTASSSSPGVNFIWTAPSGLRDTALGFPAHTIGIYQAQAISSMGCISSPNSIYVSNYGGFLTGNIAAYADVPIPGATNDTVPVCANTHPQLGANVWYGQYPYTYLWSNGSTLGSIPLTHSGNYSLTVTDANGCVVKDTAFIAYNYAPDSTIAPSIAGNACEGTTVFLTVPGVGIHCIWNTGITANTQVVTIGGTYYVTVTNEANCSSNNSYSVGFIPSPDPVVENSACNLAVAIMSPGSTYQWYRQSTLIPGATSQYYNCSATGSDWYSVKETNLGGCSGFSPVQYANCNPAGIEIVKDISEIKFYPNPCTNVISIALPSGAYTIEFSDMVGKIVFRKETTSSTEIPTGQFQPGIYFAIVKDHDGNMVHHEKIVRQ